MKGSLIAEHCQNLGLKVYSEYIILSKYGLYIEFIHIETGFIEPYYFKLLNNNDDVKEGDNIHGVLSKFEIIIRFDLEWEHYMTLWPKNKVPYDSVTQVNYSIFLSEKDRGNLSKLSDETLVPRAESFEDETINKITNLESNQSSDDNKQEKADTSTLLIIGGVMFLFLLLMWGLSGYLDGGVGGVFIYFFWSFIILAVVGFIYIFLPNK